MRGRGFAANSRCACLSRTWQMLLKGSGGAASGRPLAAAEMVLVRIAYAADLPTPDEAIRSLGDTSRGNGASVAPGGQSFPRADISPRGEAPRSSDLPRGGTRGQRLPPDSPLNCR